MSPGPVSDAFDPEWGTRARAGEISEALEDLYQTVSRVLNHAPPKYILELVGEDVATSPAIPATLTEWEWRIIRFALERAKDSI